MEEIILSLKKEIEKIGYHPECRDEHYKYVASAAIVKTYEFLSFAIDNTQNTQPFFALASLRGICEDYITLSFIKQLDESNRNQYIKCYMAIKFQEILKKQTDFFNKERRHQPVVKTNDTADNTIEKNEEILKSIAKKTGLWNHTSRSPNVFYMAKKLELKEFYEFYYSITSESVHFNPRGLMRMGWCEDPKSMTDFHFSTKNFSEYYRDFTVFYTAVLFVRMTNSLKDIFALTDEFWRKIEKIESMISNTLRWPESITYEELNIEPPSKLLRMLRMPI
jgi:hypothetical protein